MRHHKYTIDYHKKLDIPDKFDSITYGKGVNCDERGKYCYL